MGQPSTWRERHPVRVCCCPATCSPRWSCRPGGRRVNPRCTWRRSTSANNRWFQGVLLGRRGGRAQLGVERGLWLVRRPPPGRRVWRCHVVPRPVALAAPRGRRAVRRVRRVLPSLGAFPPHTLLSTSAVFRGGHRFHPPQRMGSPGHGRKRTRGPRRRV